MALQLLCAFSAADVPPCAMYPERCAKLAGSTGSAMPLVALGTWRGSYKDCSNNNYTCVRQRAKSAVSSWIELDGTHIDTANDYRTQVEVGEAVTASGRQRSELFLTTKCPGPMGFLATIQCAEDNLQMLGQYGVTTGYLDLLLIHFPFIIKPECYGSPSTEECKMPYVDPGDEARLETWRAMELLQRQGRARAIGLSDYNATQLAHTIANAKQPVAVHQVEWHPLQHDEEMAALCRAHGVQLQAWSPLGGAAGSVLSLPAVKAIAAAHGVSTAQVVLKWSLQRGVAVVTGTDNKEHMASDLDLWSFKLSEVDLGVISSLHTQQQAM